MNLLVAIQKQNTKKIRSNSTRMLLSKFPTQLRINDDVFFSRNFINFYIPFDLFKVKA